MKLETGENWVGNLGKSKASENEVGNLWKFETSFLLLSLLYSEYFRVSDQLLIVEIPGQKSKYKYLNPNRYNCRLLSLKFW